jgi:hypothetical protein
MAEDPKYAEAVNRLKTALAELKATGGFERMETKKGEVLREFQPVFTPQKIKELNGQEFRDFLKPSNNRHWSGLSRSAYVAADEEKIPDLRRALGIWLNEEDGSIADRLDRVHLKNVGKAVLTAILQVAYPDRYGVWNKRSEEGLNRLGLLPNFERKTSFGKQYETINNLLLRLSKSVGDIDLWTLDVLWFFIKDGIPDSARVAAEIAQEQAEGFSSDPKIRKAVENRAMTLAQEHYENEHYTVDATKYKNCPYDMECEKNGKTLHVEVKGTQGLGRTIILTKDEVRHAEERHVENQPMELFIVWDIKVVKGKGTVEASGGRLKFDRDWNPREKYKMECIAYRCTLPKQP